MQIGVTLEIFGDVYQLLSETMIYLNKLTIILENL